MKPKLPLARAVLCLLGRHVWSGRDYYSMHPAPRYCVHCYHVEGK